MFIPVMYEDETEAEFEIETCCYSCFYTGHERRYTENDFLKIKSILTTHNHFLLPTYLTDNISFINHLLKL